MKQWDLPDRDPKGGNVSMARDPEGNVVEIMGVPRSATGETFTWGMAVSDEAAARRFYGKTLGLSEFDPWTLPPPFSMKMYLFATGAGRVKFSAPPGQRPREADAGPDAPGLRSVILRVFLNESGFKFRPHTIKLLDSKVSLESFGRGQVPALADFNGDGFLDLFVTRHAQMQGGRSNPNDQKLGNGLYLSDGAWDVFRDVSARMGIQNEQACNRQPSLGDVNRDGWVDLVVQDRHESPNLQARAILFMNRGDGTFEPEPTTFSGLDSNGICGEAADLNNDGLLDLVFAADPDNSGVVLSMAGYESRVYWNTGLHGGKENRWLRLRFSGIKDAELIGARADPAAPTRGSRISYCCNGEIHVGVPGSPIPRITP